MRCLFQCVSALAAIMMVTVASAQPPLEVPNGGFERQSAGKTFPDGWQVGIGGGAKALAEADEAAAHSGRRSIRMENRSPRQAFVYALISSPSLPVKPQTTYVLRFFVRGKGVQGCYAGAAFNAGGERRVSLPSGDYDWTKGACRFTTPPNCTAVILHFASDDVTESLWIDDVSLEQSPVQLANLTERRYPKDFPGIFPRAKPPVAERLLVFDCNGQPDDTMMAISALQGIVNRRQPRLYLIQPTNPARQDEVWLKYMIAKGYTGAEERATSPDALFARFRSEITGVIVTDPELPGSVNAAYMMGGLKNALPVTPEMSTKLKLPVVMDLRGKWRRNVDAYRFVFDNYWDRMNHHVLSWIHPQDRYRGARDYMVAFNIFCFWVSSPEDREKGGDPEAEEAFLDELLAATPGNVPVMGWPMYGDKTGISEYAGVRWLSEYGKFVPGTGFCSNLSVHSAIRPEDGLFRQKARLESAPMRPERDRVYASLNIMDSGDALWYWMLHQRKIWADPARGSLPVGWCMNITLYDTLPVVAQWYYENATPNDTFFAGPSGLGYMNTQVYGSRFRPEDRERIWTEYVRRTDEYCRKLDMEGIELYNGSWGEKTPPSPETFRRFTRGMKGLRYILADLGRHDNIRPDEASYLLDGVAVFHTLTRFRVWSAASDVLKEKRDEANAWLLGEITASTPAQRPAFLSAMAISWYYYPSWLKDLQEKLPPRYQVVSPGTLARLFVRQQRTQP